MAIPLSITKYLRSLWMAETIITYLQIDTQGNLKSWEGHPRHYGLSNLTVGQPATEQLCFLEGLLTVPHSQKLEFVSFGGDRHAHVHIVPTADSTWILLLDATYEHDQKQKMQQQVNELTLLTYRQSQLLQGLEATRKSLEEEKQKLEDMIESKKRYISTLLNSTPVSLEWVVSYRQWFNQVEQAEARITDYLNDVKNNTNQLLSTINNVLDETQSEAGQVALHIGICNIRALLDNLVSIFQPAAQAKGLLFELEIQDTVPAQVMLDELRFRQVLINLITNALKFTAKGFVTVTIAWEEEQLTFVVADSGPGISLEAQKKLFAGLPKHITSQSMGLEISRHFIGLMGGKLTVESSPKIGAIFKGFVEAPLVHSTVVKHQNEPGTGTTVLIADTRPEARILMAMYLEEGGYLVLSADNGAVAIALTLQEQPDLLLINMQMSEVNGYEVVKQLRNQGFQNPIVGLSGSALLQDQNYAFAAGCNKYLVKPVSPEVLLQTVTDCLPPTRGE